MAEFYSTAQRELQDTFDTRALADRLETAIVVNELNQDQADFIAAQDLFFLATVDEAGFPSCSYKGGAVGFVRVLNPKTLLFPIYDGNGMFMSAGNALRRPEVGLLFIDFEKPQRLRVRGRATVHRDGPLVASYPGAQLAVELEIESAWQNCPRYVHRMERVENSAYVPDGNGEAKLALWKRIDLMQDVLSADDRAAVAAVGTISAAEYEEHVRSGQG